MYGFTYIIVLSCNLFYSVTCIGPEHERILQWWKKMSEQKPLKCQINSEYSKPLHALNLKLTETISNMNKIIASRPCTKNDVRYLVHTFKGQVINNTLEGEIKTVLFVP